MRPVWVGAVLSLSSSELSLLPHHFHRMTRLSHRNNLKEADRDRDSLIVGWLLTQLIVFCSHPLNSFSPPSLASLFLLSSKSSLLSSRRYCWETSSYTIMLLEARLRCFVTEGDEAFWRCPPLKSFLADSDLRWRLFKWCWWLRLLTAPSSSDLVQDSSGPDPLNEGSPSPLFLPLLSSFSQQLKEGFSALVSPGGGLDGGLGGWSFLHEFVGVSTSEAGFHRVVEGGRW